ncbi:hypothetical protein GQ44DRAFT_756500 [Phaeosphaeriaceae sp. PMI808]|nr:hypothetical protein GQ44DRAFT_756500 [Phaeosphaeriaceae sp. PMI808]
MKLLQVTLAGLLGVASVAAGTSKKGLSSSTKLRGVFLITTRYYCVDLTVYKCNSRTGGNCLVVDHCNQTCVNIEAPSGAGCNDSDSKVIDTRSDGNIKVQSVSVAKGKCVGFAGTCYECTPDGRGIRTCRDGICLVRLDRRCYTGWSCDDQCSCCKEGQGSASIPAEVKQVGIGETDKHDPQTEAASAAIEEKWNPGIVSRDSTLGPIIAEISPLCKPATYICSPLRESIWVCGHDGFYRLSAKCGREGTCRSSDYGAFCESNLKYRSSKMIEKSEQVTDDTMSEDPSRHSVLSPNQPLGDPTSPGSDCNPGVYRCGLLNSRIYACNTHRVWEVDLECGGYERCRIASNGVPFCTR